MNHIRTATNRQTKRLHTRAFSLPAVAILTLAWFNIGHDAAQASLPLFFTRDENTIRLLDTLTATGHLPIDAATVRHHDRKWLRNRLSKALTNADDLSPSTEQRIRELISLLDYEVSTVRIDIDEPKATAVLSLHAEMDARQRLDDPHNTTRWSMAGALQGEAGSFGFHTSGNWGVVRNASQYALGPDEFFYGGRSFPFLPDQLWREPTGYLSLGSSHVSLQIGKMDVAWGPGRNASLLLSDNTDSKSGARFSALLGPLRFESLTATMPHARQESYLSAHRLTIRASNNLAVTFAESVVYKDRLELAYVNPITIYLLSVQGVERALQRGSDNQMIGGEIVWRVRPGTILFAEGMLDDAQVQEGGNAFKNWDTKFAAQIGVRATEPCGMSDTTLRAEYAFANQYAYTHERDGLNYTLSAESLGLSLGPDADGLWLDGTKWLSAHSRVGLAFRLTRKGEQTVGTPHEINGPIEWEFLSGVPEIHREIEASWGWSRVGHTMLDLNLSVDPVSNVGHQPGQSETRWRMSVAARTIL